jgi:hypothetical protein
MTASSPGRRLTAADLFSLEQYARMRREFRTRVLEHKRLRNIAVGPNTTWCFEDRLTVQYQIQEMLRTERIFEPEGIEEELQSYNPLIPDGSNLKATLLIEFTDAEERRVALEQLRGLERCCWVAVAGERSVGIADEDMERENATKTSAVHFLRFELSATACAALKDGALLELGTDHEAYRHRVAASPATSRALAADLA